MHVNGLRKSVEDDVKVCRLDVVDDEEEEGCVLEGYCEGFQQEELDVLITKFDGLFSEVPGRLVYRKCALIRGQKGQFGRHRIPCS